MQDTIAHLGVYLSPPSPGAQRVNVYSGLGLQLSCLELPGSQAHMPFLAGQRTPWRASPAPDPHREEGAPQCLPCQKKRTTFAHLAPQPPLSSSPPCNYYFRLYKGLSGDHRVAMTSIGGWLCWAMLTVKGAGWHSDKTRR